MVPHARARLDEQIATRESSEGTGSARLDNADQAGLDQRADVIRADLSWHRLLRRQAGRCDRSDALAPLAHPGHLARATTVAKASRQNESSSPRYGGRFPARRGRVGHNLPRTKGDLPLDTGRCTPQRAPLPPPYRGDLYRSMPWRT